MQEREDYQQRGLCGRALRNAFGRKDSLGAWRFIRHRAETLLRQLHGFFLISLIFCFVILPGVSPAQVATTSSSRSAVDLQRLTAEGYSGNALAQYILGITYAHGEVVPQDYAEAIKWFQKAAQQGLDVAENDLGSMYVSGQGVPLDYKAAVKWFRKAAGEGLAEAENNLGVMYAAGHGVPLDYQEAARRFRKAAFKGSAGAQCNLGIAYASGHGEVRNYKEAVKWFLEAAAQGDSLAQFDLGRAYAGGLGVRQDSIQALMWLTLAASGGETQARESRDYLSRSMTQEQIEKADHLAALISGGFVQETK
jgi:TPR repeat protein